MRLKQRRSLDKWSPAEIAADVESAFHGDPQQQFVRAAVVVRYAYERMPKDTIAKWKKDAVEDYPGKGLPTHGVFMFDLAEDRYFALHMDRDSSAVIDEVRAVHGLQEACEAAEAWVGEPCEEVSLMNVPGIYQSAMIEMVTGVERDWNEFRLSWWFPGDQQYVPYRQYPPPADEGDERFVLMPSVVGQASFRAFLGSRTLDKAM
jgi:hypothetical protein